MTEEKQEHSTTPLYGSCTTAALNISLESFSAGPTVWFHKTVAPWQLHRLIRDLEKRRAAGYETDNKNQLQRCCWTSIQVESVDQNEMSSS